MGEPLKNHFGTDIPIRIAGMVSEVHPSFDSKRFVQRSIDGYEALELKERGRHIASILRAFLPQDFAKAADILVRSAGPKLEKTEGNGMAPFLYFPFLCFIEQHGLDHFDAAMSAQYELTQRFSAEFSVRPYIGRYPKKSLAILTTWTSDDSEHVRRLVSEGTRPRLPWASRIPEFQADPSPVIALLERLKDDPSLYVRRSVANNLNDIGKDHPDILLNIARQWSNGASQERMWLIRHGLRSLIKEGNSEALAVLGIGTAESLTILSSSITPESLPVGSSISISYKVQNDSATSQAIMADFRIHYVKANGAARPKVFKMRAFELDPGASQVVRKTISVADMTTRKHYEGIHHVDALLNGSIFPLGSFDLFKPAS